MGSTMKMVLGRVCDFRAMDLFERAICTLVAHYSREKEVEGLREKFRVLDVSGNGSLEKEEVQDAFTSAGFEFSKQELEDIFQALDADGSGRVYYTEWLAATLKPSNIKAEDVVKELFNFFDFDQSGSVSRDEISALLGDDVAQNMMNSMDWCGYKDFAWEEFRDMVFRIADAR